MGELGMAAVLIFPPTSRAGLWLVLNSVRRFIDGKCSPFRAGWKRLCTVWLLERRRAGGDTDKIVPLILTSHFRSHFQLDLEARRITLCWFAHLELTEIGFKSSDMFFF